MSTLQLKDFLRPQVMQQIQNSVAKSSGMAIHFADMYSDLTQPSNQSELFVNFIQKSDFAMQKYREVENKAKEQAYKSLRPAISQCNSGLVVTAVPLVLKGECVGAIIAGQVFVEKQDENAMKRIAHEYRVDEAGYINSARKIKVTTRQKLEALLDSLFLMSGIIMDMGYQKLVASEKYEKFVKYSESLKLHLSEAESLLSNNESSVKDLTKKFEELSTLSDVAMQKLENTSETVKVIQNIALNTRILGFNASIEASRAKESGKGFGVIAQEVRSLADVSKNSAEKIEEIIQAISETTNQIRATVVETNEAVNQTFATMGSMTDLLDDMRTMSNDLG